MAITQITFENIEILKDDKTKGVFEFIAEINPSFPRIPKGRNPRAVDHTRQRYADIVKGLEGNPNFEDFNRGLLLTATDVIVDKSSTRCVVCLDDTRNEGHFDGGHTEHAIHAKLATIASLGRRVRIRIYTGNLTDGEIKAMAYANNNMKPQEERNHVDLEGGFNELKSALGALAQNISFFDGDPGAYRIEDIIGFEIATTGNVATKFFETVTGRSKKVTSLRDFYRKGATHKVKWHVSRHADLNKLCTGRKPIIRDVATLWDYIVEKSERLYDASGTRSSYARLSLHEKPLTTRNLITTTLSGNPVSNALPFVMSTMILEGLLRHELVLDSSYNLNWRGSPAAAEKRYAASARDVIKFLNDRWLAWSASGGSARDFSEDASVWTEVYQRLI